MKRVLFLLFMLLSLQGCSDTWLGATEKDFVLEGDRINIIPSFSSDEKLLEDSIELSKPYSINSIDEKWSVRNFNTSISPVIDSNFIYTMNNKGHISCFDIKTGKRKWIVNVSKKNEDTIGVFGGGLVLGSNSILVSTGFGDLFSLDKTNGGMIWKYSSVAPFIGSPFVKNNIVTAVNKENQVIALSENNGEIIWKQKGTPEEASVLANLQIAGNDDFVIPTYTSGEVFLLNINNGRELWSDVLGLIYKNAEINAISDISSSNVIAGDLVISNGLDNQMVAINIKTGHRVWQKKIKSLKTPVVIGDYIYVFTTDNTILALSAVNGGMYWKKELNTLYEDSNVEWSNMSVYKNNIIINNSLEDIVFISAVDGEINYKKDISSFSNVAPLVGGNILYILESSERLTSYQLN